jgi:glycosyltransferase involved in cell wall biosynthesis
MRESNEGISSRLNQDIELSVIVPSYNTAEFIGESLDSIFTQNFQSLEVIVINDGSPDTAELETVLRPYCERIIYIKQENRGLAGARNTGIREAKGKYLAFLDSDDVWPREFLTTQIKFFEQDPALDLVYADAILFGTVRLPRETFMQTSHPPVNLEGLLAEGGQIVPSGVVMKKRTAVEAGLFDETLRRCEDYDLWLRIAQRGAKIAFQPSVKYLRRIHSGALTADEPKMVADLIRALSKLKNGGGLSPTCELLLDKQLTQYRAELGLFEGKRALIAGDYVYAREHLTTAYDFFKTTKLRLVLVGLRYAPRVTAWAIRRGSGIRRLRARMTRA